MFIAYLVVFLICGHFHIAGADASDLSICDFVAATNIQHIILPGDSIVFGWGCSASHLPLTDPCIGVQGSADPNADFPRWTGVTCDDFGISGISLSGIGLSGSLPPTLGQLTTLTDLDLGYNSLQGSIPRMLGELTQLTALRLNNNSLHGWVPEAFFCSTSMEVTPGDATLGLQPQYIAGMTKLTALDLSGNRLSGALPVSSAAVVQSAFSTNYFYCYRVLESLVTLALGDNSITGKLPNEMGHVVLQLVEMRLQNNWFSGPLPFGLGGVSTPGAPHALQVLELRDNSFSGDIPSSFRHLTALRTLTLSNNSFEGIVPLVWLCAEPNSNLQSFDARFNQFSGEIPTAVGRCLGLQHLLLGHNRLAHELPTAMGALSRLRTLHLNHNRIAGQLPSEIGHWRELTELQLQHNLITGSIPSDTGRMGALQSLDLTGNSFAGSTLPPELLHCSSLRRLALADADLEGRLASIEQQRGVELEIAAAWRQMTRLELQLNEFSGPLPPSLGFLIHLEVLKLDDNELTGTIPDTFGELHRLVELHLDVNNFNGSLPRSFGNLNNLQSISVSNNLLEGTLPSFFQNYHALQVLDVGNNLFSGSVPTYLSGVSSNPQNPNTNMGHLREIYLNNNHFEGYIPSSVCTLERLQVLVFNDNPNISCYDTCLNKYRSHFTLKINVGNAVPCDSYGNPTYRPTPAPSLPLGMTAGPTAAPSVAPSAAPVPSYAPSVVPTEGSGNSSAPITGAGGRNNPSSNGVIASFAEFFSGVVTSWLLDVRHNPIGLLLPLLFVFLKFGNYTTNQKHSTSNDFIFFHIFAWFVHYFECLFWCCHGNPNSNGPVAEVTSQKRRAAHYYSQIRPDRVHGSDAECEEEFSNRVGFGGRSSRSSVRSGSSGRSAGGQSSGDSDASHIQALRAAATQGSQEPPRAGLYRVSSGSGDPDTGAGGDSEEEDGGRVEAEAEGLSLLSRSTGTARSRGGMNRGGSSSSSSSRRRNRDSSDHSDSRSDISGHGSRGLARTAGNMLERLQASFNNVWFDTDVSLRTGGAGWGGGSDSGSGFSGNALHAAFRDFRQREQGRLPPPVNYTGDEDSSGDEDVPPDLVREMEHAAVEYTGDGEEDEELGLMGGTAAEAAEGDVELSARQGSSDSTTGTEGPYDDPEAGPVEDEGEAEGKGGGDIGQSLGSRSYVNQLLALWGEGGASASRGGISGASFRQAFSRSYQRPAAVNAEGENGAADQPVYSHDPFADSDEEEDEEEDDGGATLLRSSAPRSQHGGRTVR